MTEPPKEVLDAIEADTPRETDKLVKLRQVAEQYRELLKEIDGIEELLETKEEERIELAQTIIPDLMDEAGVPAIELDAKGNLPKVRVAINPFYSAGIAASWDEERKALAYQWLDDSGNGDLIKTIITIDFPREQRPEALKVMRELKGRGFTVEVKETVKSQTLTAWLREIAESGGKMPPLDVIGGVVVRRVKMTELKK